MIVAQLLALLNHPDEDEQERLGYDFVDQFRKGGNGNPNDIVLLLDSTEAIARNYGCYILCETSIEDQNLRKTLMEKLGHILKNDSDEYNRVRAFDALYGMYLDHEDTDGLLLFCQEMKNNAEDMIQKACDKYIEKYKTKPDRHDFKNYHSYLNSWLYTD